VLVLPPISVARAATIRTFEASLRRRARRPSVYSCVHIIFVLNMQAIAGHVPEANEEREEGEGEDETKRKRRDTHQQQLSFIG